CPEGARRRFEISPATHTLPTPPSSASRTSAASWVTVRMRGAGSARSIARAYISPFAARHEGLEDLPALEQLEGVVELRVGAELASSGRMVCTEPLPKVCVPRTRARLWSWSAPATISEALALPPFTSTTIGKSPHVPGLCAKYFCFWFSSRPSV